MRTGFCFALMYCFPGVLGMMNTGMDPLIVTIIIALGISIVGVFVVSWLYRQALNKRFDNLRKYLDARFAERECAPRVPSSNL